MRSRLFLVDSSPAVQRLVEQACEAEGCEVNAFRRAHNALDAAKRQKPDVVVVDYHLEDMAFSAFCERLMAKDCLPNTPIISLVGSSDRIDERQMHTMGVKAVLKKPLQADDLMAMVRSLRGNGAAKDGAAKELGPPPVVDHAMVLSAEPPPDPVDPVLRLSELAAKPNTTSSESTPDSKPIEPMAEAMRGVFAQLRQSLLEQAERTVSTRLPELVTQEVKTQVESAQTTMDRLLPAMVQDTIKTAAAPLMQELIEKQLRESVDSAVTRWLAESTKEHLSRMDQLVMGKAEEAALRQARETADRVVREVAQEMVKGVFEQVLREMMAGLALTR